MAVSYRIRRRFIVLPAIHFNDEHPLAANKIADVVSIGSWRTNLWPSICRLRIRFQRTVSASVWLPRKRRAIPVVLLFGPRIAMPLTRIAPDDAAHRRGNPTSPRKRAGRG